MSQIILYDDSNTKFSFHFLFICAPFPSLFSFISNLVFNSFPDNVVCYLLICVYLLYRQDDENSKEKDIDAVLQYHQNMQEKVADEMVRMAQSLKHTSMMANNIIQQDNKVTLIIMIR